jgi:hypothetical protein
MEDLLTKVIEAHGGLKHWQQFNTIQVKMVSGGKLFDLKEFPQDSTPRQMTAYLQVQQASMQPFGAANQKTNFTSGRIAIETVEGKILSERIDTVAIIHQHLTADKWDALDRAYFNGYAMWTYLTTPFFMLMPGFIVTETESWQEENERWRVLKVTFPPEIASHCTTQYFYFGEDYLLRRHDYEIDIAGTFNAAQYVYDFIEIEGLKLPTKRRAYKRDANNKPIPDQLMVAIDLSDIYFY